MEKRLAFWNLRLFFGEQQVVVAEAGLRSDVPEVEQPSLCP